MELMSAISGYINTIRNAVYGEQVRGAIVSALETCYSDVNAPSLQKEGFAQALEEAYAGGILDIQTVTQISAMTNQAIIYRYNGVEAGKQKGLYYYSPISSAWVLIGSEVHSVSLANQMTDTNAIYKYTGTETGMVQNSLYCYNGTSWIPIGSGVLTASTVAGMTNQQAIYKYTGTETGYIQNALYYHNGTGWVAVSPPVVTDKTLSVYGSPADAKAVGDALNGSVSLLSNRLNEVPVSSVLFDGKSLIFKNVAKEVIATVSVNSFVITQMFISTLQDILYNGLYTANVADKITNLTQFITEYLPPTGWTIEKTGKTLNITGATAGTASVNGSILFL